MRGLGISVREGDFFWGLRDWYLYEGYETPSCIGFAR
jgi:hypothetical protein